MTGNIKKTNGQAAVTALGKRSTRTTAGSARLALTDADWSWGASLLQARSRGLLNNFMKTKIALSLCVVLGVSFISARAADNPAQALARLALEQKLKQPNAWEPQPLTESKNLPSVAAVPPSSKPAARADGTVSARTAVLQTAPVATTRVAAPVPTAPTVAASTTIAPEAAAPDVVVPAVVQPAVVTPIAGASAVTVRPVTMRITSLLMVSFLIASVLAVMGLLLKLRQMKLKLRDLDSRY
jgi:hypothetical protein